MNGVATSVFGGDDQLDLTGLTEFGLAQQQPARITFAAAHGPQVLDFSLVVVAVKTAHHALAAGGDDARHGLYFKRHICGRFATQVQCQCLKFYFLATGYPALGFDACHHPGWPKGVDTAKRLHFTVRVSVGGLQQQLLSLFAGRHVCNRDLARAVFVERQGQFVGDHALVL